MKSFKQYITEATLHKPITQHIFNNYASGPYKNNIKHTYENGRVLLRGSHNEKLIHNAISLYGFSDSERKSANTSNMYNAIVSSGILDSWEKYPKRNTSFICTNDKHYASGYGTILAVIPPDGTLLGECSSFDFWYSFKFLKRLGFEAMDDFNSILELFIDIVMNDDSVNTLGTQSTEYIRNEIVKCSNKIRKLGSQKLLEHVKSELQKNDDVWGHGELILNLTNDIIKNSDGTSLDFIKYLDDIMSPATNDFKLVDYTQITETGRRELWFSGNALFVSDFGEFNKMCAEYYK